MQLLVASQHGAHVGFATYNANYGWVEAESDQALETNVWYHVAGVYDGNQLSVYINGAQSTPVTVNGDPPTITEPEEEK